MVTTIKSITGYDDYLYHHMKESFKKAKKIDIIVSFLMESGVKLLEQDLIELKTKNIPIRILTGNYLNITQPSALYRLKDIFGDSADLRFFNEPNRSFHAKSYFFEYEDGADMYIGSSNLSKSAFTSGVEWNFKLDKLTHQVEYERYHQVFEDLFYNHSIKITDAELDFYSKNWKKNKIYQTTPFPNTNFTEVAADEAPSYVTDLYSPRGAQIEALYHLKKTREEGFDKGLVVAATVVATDNTFLVEIICDELNIRQKADFNSKIVGTVKRGEVYTIIQEENGLGKLKSGAGYISLNSKYVERK